MQNLSDPRTNIWKEAILWYRDGSEIEDYLNDYELRRCVEPNELLGMIRGLLNQENLSFDNDSNKMQLSLLTEVLETIQEDNESEYELQLSY